MLVCMVANSLPQHGSALPSGILAPVRVLAILLIVVFAVESLIMLVLLSSARFMRGHAWVPLIDAPLLVLVMFPVLWFMVVRPLRTLVADRGRLLARTLEIQERERAELACELHDELGQTQTAILLGLKTLTAALSLDQARERADALRGLAVAAVDSTRRMVRALSPAVLLDFGLAKAIERLCEDLTAATGVQVVCDAELGAARFAAAAEIAAYRVAQEAVTNALKHSGAAQVNVELRHSRQELQLVVRDTGRGFNHHTVTSSDLPAGGLGVSGMRERVLMLGGRFSIRSEAGAGTTVEAAIPAGPSA